MYIPPAVEYEHASTIAHYFIPVTFGPQSWNIMLQNNQGLMLGLAHSMCTDLVRFCVNQEYKSPGTTLYGAACLPFIAFRKGIVCTVGSACT